MATTIRKLADDATRIIRTEGLTETYPRAAQVGVRPCEVAAFFDLGSNYLDDDELSDGDAGLYLSALRGD